MLAEASRLGQIFFNPKKKKNCPCGFTPSHSYNLKKKKMSGATRPKIARTASYRPAPKLSGATRPPHLFNL